ncbi:MAG: PEP-CTERM sorting domain-containing protein [Phycisphaerae bacterium]
MYRISVMLVCIGVMGATATADIANGSFSNGTTTGWTTDLTQLASSQVLPIYANTANVLKLTTTNNYTWVTDAGGGHWSLDEADYSKADVWQMCFAPSGATAMEFRLSATYQGASVFGTSASGMPTAVVSATYLTLGGTVNTPTVVVNAQDWNTPAYMDLPGVDTAQLVTIRIMLTSELSADEPQGGSSKTVVVGGYFDDFRFVPEPSTAILVLWGVAAVFCRRSRRRV